MNIKNCEDCKSRWVCSYYECWLSFGEEEPNADMCPYFLDDEDESEDEED